jgi:hypothetical protein
MLTPVHTLVVEPHAVDQRAHIRGAKHPRPRITGLRSRRHGAELDMAEADPPERVQIIRILVEAGGESQGMGKLEAETGEGQA